MNKKGNLFLIPNTLGSEDASGILPEGIGLKIANVSTLFVEHPKEARRLLIALGLKSRLDEILMISVNNGLTPEDKILITEELEKGKDLGILSDAGCPAIADPGNEIVQIAHQVGAKVIPLVGPSSLLLGLMASGFNGQHFVFHGYLPKDQNQRKRKIRDMEKEMYQKSQTQLFIETPYRNVHLFNDLLSECEKKTKICLALNLTLPDEQIQVETIENWRKNKPNIDKKPCLFLMYK